MYHKVSGINYDSVLIKKIIKKSYFVKLYVVMIFGKMIITSLDGITITILEGINITSLSS